MSTKPSILFVFEGERKEPLVFNKLRTFLKKKQLEDIEFTILLYQKEIYQLYKQMSKQGEEDFEDKDLFTILKKADKSLSHHNRDDFSEIYLFFDYDGHATEARDYKIEELLKLFDNETENGKLYISYPMIEAICHFCSLEGFKELTFSCKGQNCPVKQRDECSGCKKYKEEVGKNSAPGVSNLKPNVWPTLIDAHLKKANYIIENNYVFPKQLITQLSIFENQKDKYINNKTCPQVAVLSAIPIFLLDYYGVDKIRTDVIETT